MYKFLELLTALIGYTAITWLVDFSDKGQMIIWFVVSYLAGAFMVCWLTKKEGK